MRRLLALVMLVTAISLTGHFVADAICVLLTAVDGAGLPPHHRCLPIPALVAPALRNQSIIQIQQI
jgi:hypothetical protein